MEVGFYPHNLTALTLEAYPSRQEQVESREMIRAVKAMNETAAMGNRNELTYSWDRDLRRPVVRLVNRETGEVIRQIPAQELLEMARALADLAPASPLETE
jgi:flagellar protein FlaG